MAVEQGGVKPPECPIHKKEMVCRACMEAARKRRWYSKKHPKDEQLYTVHDCLETFRKRPTAHLTCKDLVELAPKSKQASAKAGHTVFARVQYLHKRGQIKRIGVGVYKLCQKKEAKA